MFPPLHDKTFVMYHTRHVCVCVCVCVLTGGRLQLWSIARHTGLAEFLEPSAVILVLGSQQLWSIFGREPSAVILVLGSQLPGVGRDFCFVLRMQGGARPTRVVLSHCLCSRAGKYCLPELCCYHRFSLLMPWLHCSRCGC